MDIARSQLLSLEKEVDALIQRSPLFQLAPRVLLAGIHFSLFELQYGHYFGLGEGANKAETITTRLSYVLPQIAAMSVLEAPASAAEAVMGYQQIDPDRKHLLELYSYAHFSEFMPEVHRGYYKVELTGGVLWLRHRDEAFGTFQAQDILLSELGLTFANRERKMVDRGIYEIAALAPAYDLQIAQRILREKTSFYLRGLAEANLITDEGVRQIFGFGYEVFYRIRGAIMAYAEFALELSVAMARLSFDAAGRVGISHEALEWISRSEPADEFEARIVDGSGAALEEVQRFLSFYCIDFRARPARHHGGDGFFPPFARVGDDYVFAPLLVVSFISLRNAIHAFSRQNAKAFNDHVSHQYEPVLISQAVELFRRSGPWRLKSNVGFEGGELDLVIAGEQPGAALLIQAKGPLPPQGARLTQRLAGRIAEGLEQVQRFRDLASEEQQSIVEGATGWRIPAAELRHGLLARACFGAQEALAGEREVEPITLPILSLAVGAMRGNGDPADVDRLLVRLGETRRSFFKEAQWYWQPGRTEICGRTVSMPLLQFNDEAVASARHRAWTDSILLPR